MKRRDRRLIAAREPASGAFSGEEATTVRRQRPHAGLPDAAGPHRAV